MLATAVADGAGSAEHSELGASAAVIAALDYLEEQLPSTDELTDEAWNAIASCALDMANLAIVLRAESLNVEPRELASTLLIAIASPLYIAAAQVGDGAIVARLEGGEIKSVTAPYNGEYPNETVIITSQDVDKALQATLLRGNIAGIALFTDGLQAIALSSLDNSPHIPFFEPMFRFAAAVSDQDEAVARLEEFLGSPRFEQRTDDDLTLVIASVGD
jgi:hypothetical protein